MRNINEFRQGVFEKYDVEKRIRKKKRKRLTFAATSMVMSFTVFIVGALIFASAFQAPLILLPGAPMNEAPATGETMAGAADAATTEQSEVDDGALKNESEDEIYPGEQTPTDTTNTNEENGSQPEIPETTKVPETTRAPETPIVPETTKVPETTVAPTTTSSPETTRFPEFDETNSPIEFETTAPPPESTASPNVTTADPPATQSPETKEEAPSDDVTDGVEPDTNAPLETDPSSSTGRIENLEGIQSQIKEDERFNPFFGSANIRFEGTYNDADTQTESAWRLFIVGSSLSLFIASITIFLIAVFKRS